MAVSRLDRMRALAESRPGDPFVWYSLAMETRKSDLAAALTLFERVREKHPSYVPTYYQYAKALEESGDVSRALAIYREGLSAARSAGDAHAASELSAAIDLLS